MATNANEVLDRLTALLDAATPGPWAAPALIRLARAAAILADDANSTKGGTMLRDWIKALGEVSL